MFAHTREVPSLGTSPWETPFGIVEDGIDNAIRFYSYGDMPPWGAGPDPNEIFRQGSLYIETNFPLMDKFETCSVERIQSADKAEEL